MRLHRILLIPALFACAQARADVVISNDPTSNMTCSDGVCQATSANAVLNAGDLAGLLASGDVTVTTGTLSYRIIVDAPLSWTSASTLSLTALEYLLIKQPIVVAGRGGLTTDIWPLFPAAGAHVEFTDKKSALTIAGDRYRLATSFNAFRRLAFTSQFVALAKSVKAPKTAFSSSPITDFGSHGGALEGLGNTISRLSIDDETSNDNVGLVGTLESDALVRDIRLSRVSVRAVGAEKVVGTVVGESFGHVRGSYATGTVSASGTASYVGGLVGRSESPGIIDYSLADVAVTVDGTAFVEGGMAGLSTMAISESYATGAVQGADDTIMGGLVGFTGAFNNVSECFATGSVTGGDAATVGGLVGAGDTDGKVGSAIFDSYSTGAVSGGPHAIMGGVIGVDSPKTRNEDGYWDLDLSDVTDPSRGAGNIANDKGLTGLTTAQLQAHRPKGFSKRYWRASPGTNDGFPYLVNVQPPK